MLGQRLTDLSAAPLPFARVVDLFHMHPQLAAKLFFSFSCEAAIFAEHLIAIGRRTALERVAHFLLELPVRLQAVQLANEPSFCLPLTQELIADALGLNIPYVNQVLRSVRTITSFASRTSFSSLMMLKRCRGSSISNAPNLKPLSIADLMDEAA